MFRPYDTSIFVSLSEKVTNKISGNFTFPQVTLFLVAFCKHAFKTRQRPSAFHCLWPMQSIFEKLGSIIFHLVQGFVFQPKVSILEHNKNGWKKYKENWWHGIKSGPTWARLWIHNMLHTSHKRAHKCLILIIVPSLLSVFLTIKQEVWIIDVPCQPPAILWLIWVSGLCWSGFNYFTVINDAGDTMGNAAVLSLLSDQLITAPE